MEALANAVECAIREERYPCFKKYIFTKRVTEFEQRNSSPRVCFLRDIEIFIPFTMLEKLGGFFPVRRPARRLIEKDLCGWS